MRIYLRKETQKGSKTLVISDSLSVRYLFFVNAHGADLSIVIWTFCKKGIINRYETKLDQIVWNQCLNSFLQFMQLNADN